MSALDIHLLTSVTEAFPNVIAESMLCEVPSVCTDVGDAAYIVGETGWVVPSGDVDAFVQGIKDAIFERETHMSLWRERAVACRRRVEDLFSFHEMLKQYDSAWRSLYKRDQWTDVCSNH